MNNLAHKAYNIESIKNEFLNIGFSEEAIDFVFLHNDNYTFEHLKEKLIDLEKNLRKDISNLDVKIDSVKNELNTKIDNVENNLRKDISNLDVKIDNVEKNLNTKIDSVNTKIDFVEKNLQKDLFILNTKIDNVEKNLNTKIDNVEKNLNTQIDNEVKNLRKDLNMGNRLIHFMILAAAILGPFIHSFLMQYIQGVK
ncbi:Bdr family repetitive protein [Borreliella bavariensis]|uniref:Bdr family repetitive protein n=1 Tax=Borreliella bavariensis TaxID=664662 RepID=UPI001C0072A6|nr:Bdr family repetitive protein [Borreliella bavariensis]